MSLLDRTSSSTQAFPQAHDISFICPICIFSLTISGHFPSVHACRRPQLLFSKLLPPSPPSRLILSVTRTGALLPVTAWALAAWLLSPAEGFHEKCNHTKYSVLGFF